MYLHEWVDPIVPQKKYFDYVQEQAEYETTRHSWDNLTTEFQILHHLGCYHKILY